MCPHHSSADALDLAGVAGGSVRHNEEFTCVERILPINTGGTDINMDHHELVNCAKKEDSRMMSKVVDYYTANMNLLSFKDENIDGGDRGGYFDPNHESSQIKTAMSIGEPLSAVSFPRQWKVRQ